MQARIFGEQAFAKWAFQSQLPYQPKSLRRGEKVGRISRSSINISLNIKVCNDIMPEVAAFSSAWADPDLRVAQWQDSREWRSVLGHLGAFSAFEAMTKAILVAAVALLLTCASVVMHPATDERAMYGFEGPLEQNWLPRMVGGWPAPFLADSPDTSVPHQIGPEDHFRPGPFVADLAFWAIVTLGAIRAWRVLRR